MFAAGFFSGILNKSEMLTEMAGVVTSMIPASMAPLFAIICGVIAFVFSILLGADGFHYGMMPLIIKAGETFGFGQTGLVYIMCRVGCGFPASSGTGYILDDGWNVQH